MRGSQSPAHQEPSTQPPLCPLLSGRTRNVHRPRGTRGWEPPPIARSPTPPAEGETRRQRRSGRRRRAPREIWRDCPGASERTLKPQEAQGLRPQESDLSSGDHSFGGSEDSKTSEAENKSSSNEPTVRQLRRQRKSIKTWPCSQEGLENSTSTGGRTLKWDYSGIGLADSPTISNQGSVNGNMGTDTGAPACNSSVMGTEAGMLQSIYSSIKDL
ncbi:hypothetical protein NDU88_004674 [Pleurodeles waltl]|uniref:Uncharacterized protein n=1 Tax=Pleurodeles waltl TaxID=8319 RepID=A0AAV7TAE4_PLEWA|nr:hypothetical protein NDU88_004674 [Pleurodeles waltl]